MGRIPMPALTGAAGLAPLALRLAGGIVMTAHGLSKLGSGPEMFGETLAMLGVPLPVLTAWLVALIELLGGIALLVGLLTRLAAALETIVLVVAMLLVKVNVGFISGDGGAGAELDIALIAVFVGLLLLGPGRLSIDYAVGVEREASDSA